MTDPDPTQPATGSVYGQPPSSSPGPSWPGAESTGTGTVYGPAAGGGTTAPIGPGAGGPAGTSAATPHPGPSAPAWAPPAPAALPPPAAPAWPSTPSSPAGYGAYEGSYGTSSPPAGHEVPAPVPVGPAKANRGVGFTTGVALLALLLGLTGVALGVYAVGVARDAKTVAAGGSGATTQPQPTPGGQTDNTSGPTGPTDTGAPTATSTAGDLNPQAAFTIKYEAQTLLVHPAGGCDSNSIDLDIPAVNVSSGADLSLHTCNGNETWQVPDGVQLATADSGDLQPKDCANLIRTSARPSVDIPVSTPNLVMCMTTSFADAQSQGISWKISLIRQTSLTQDGTVSITVTTWNIPQ